MTTAPVCPDCRTPVQIDWDWCQGCGFDPGGLRPVGWAPPPSVRAPEVAGRRVKGPATGPRLLTVILAIAAGIVLIGGVAFFTVGTRAIRSAAGTRAGAGAQDPVAVASPDGAFTVSVEGPATLHDSTQPDGMVIHTFGWDGGANGEFVAYFDLPAAPPTENVQRLLTGGVDTMINGKGTSSPAPFEGHDALQFSSYGSTAMTGVAFFDGPRMYIVAAAGPYASAPAQAQRFTSSFHLNR